MKRAHLNFVVDAVAFVAFAVILSTGFLLRYVLPPGSGRLEGAGTGWRSAEKTVSLVWGYTRHEWGAFHFWVSVALMAVLALHVILHWRWVVGVVRGRRTSEGSGARFGLGVMGLVAVVVICITPFLGQKKTLRRGAPNASTPQTTEAQESADHSGHAIQGSMTLREVEQETGVPVTYILEKLGIPVDTSPDERLGRLRRAHDFQIDDVREIVAGYQDGRP